MGTVVEFRRAIGHARPPSPTLKPNTAGDASKPLLARASRKRTNLSCAILPRDRQLLTAGKPTPAKADAAVGPPTASMTESTVSSMSGICSQNVKMSTFHGTAIEFAPAVRLYKPMAETLKSLGNRLKMTREALGISQADLCKRIKVKPNRWSQYEGGERRITIDVANALCDEFKLSLDWIYRADPAQLPHALRLKMPRAA